MAMRGSGLRSRLFRAIGVVVLICVALTIGLGIVLTRRAVDRATLQDVAHQADLIAAAQRNSVSSLRSLPTRIQAILNRQHELLLFQRSDLPAQAQERLAHNHRVQGTMTFGGAPYYFAARLVNPGTLILLRPRSTAGSLLSPYVWGLLIAAAAGGLLAAIAAFLVARRLARMHRTDFSVRNTEIDLAEVAEDAVRRYQQQADSFGVALTAVAGAAAPAIGDADRVLQVVSNLVENALRLTPPDGEVRVIAALGVLRVEDTGPGLAEAA